MRKFIYLTILPLVGWLSVWTASAYSADDRHSLVLQWLDLESQKGRLQSEWREREEMLSRRLELLEIEAGAIEQSLAQAKASTSEIDARRQSLLEDQAVLEREQRVLGEQLAEAILKAQRLQHRLPPPLQAEWSEKLAMAARDDASNSQKLEKLLSMYQLLDEFNSRLALHKVAMQVSGSAGDKQVMVSQFYLGLAHGWYVSDGGEFFGYGRPTEQGWRWWQGEDASQALGRELDASVLLKVQAMLESPTTADYLPLPIVIDSAVNTQEGIQ